MKANPHSVDSALNLHYEDLQNLQNLTQAPRKGDVFTNFLTGFQLELGQLWPHVWCGILDAVVQKSTGKYCEIPQAYELQSQKHFTLLTDWMFPSLLHNPCSELVMEAFGTGRAIWVWGSSAMPSPATSSAEGSSIPPSSPWAHWGMDLSSLWCSWVLAVEMQRGFHFQWVLSIFSTFGAVRNLKVWVLTQDFAGTCPSSVCKGEIHLKSKCKREEVETQGHQHQTERLQRCLGVAGSVSHWDRE